MGNVKMSINRTEQENGVFFYKSTLISRNITILGKRTSVRLEPEMWAAIKAIANREKCAIHDLCSLISLRKRPNSSLTAAIRVFIMLYYKASSTEEGHHRAGHGNFENMKVRARIKNTQAPSFYRVNAADIVCMNMERQNQMAANGA